MICSDCQDRKHKKCKGGTWCDCQHVVKGKYKGKKDKA